MANINNSFPWATVGNMSSELAGYLPDKKYRLPDGTQMSRATIGEDITSDSLKYAGIGASIGTLVPGVGTAIGAGVGALAGVASGYFRGMKDKKEMSDYFCDSFLPYIRDKKIDTLLN